MTGHDDAVAAWREADLEARADEWRKEDCGCGHGRTVHEGGTGACLGTRVTVNYAALPAPQFAPGTSLDDFMAEPINWPAELPRHVVPCPCKSFAEPEPFNPHD